MTGPDLERLRRELSRRGALRRMRDDLVAGASARERDDLFDRDDATELDLWWLLLAQPEERGLLLPRLWPGAVAEAGDFDRGCLLLERADGRIVVTRDADGEVALGLLASGAADRVLKASPREVTTGVLRRDGDRITGVRWHTDPDGAPFATDEILWGDDGRPGQVRGRLSGEPWSTTWARQTTPSAATDLAAAARAALAEALVAALAGGRYAGAWLLYDADQHASACAVFDPARTLDELGGEADWTTPAPGEDFAPAAVLAYDAELDRRGDPSGAAAVAVAAATLANARLTERLDDRAPLVLVAPNDGVVDHDVLAGALTGAQRARPDVVRLLHQLRRG